MATTNPDNLPYPADYADPADAPAAYRALAEATQAALDQRAPTSHSHNYAPTSHSHDYAPTSHLHDARYLSGGTSGPTSFWDTYYDITTVEPNWQPLWPGHRVPTAQGMSGIWRVECHAYLYVKGGDTSPQGLLFGVDGNWQDGTLWNKINGQAVTLGRLTAGPGQEIRVQGYAVYHHWNYTGKYGPQAWPVAQLIGSKVAGSIAQVGQMRITQTFIPAPNYFGAEQF